LFQQLLQLLPHNPGNIALLVAVGGAFIGIILWLFGVRFGRVILTLGAVAAGTAIGMKLPEWFDWSIDPMATGVGMALFTGLTAYALHRVYAGAAFGIVLCAWAALGTWIFLGHGTWHPPTYGQGFPKFLSDAWNALPKDMRRWLPYLAASSMLVGMTIGILWPKLSNLLLWSSTGATIVFCSISTLLFHFRPQLLDHLPRHFGTQAAWLGGAMAIGIVTQWWTSPRPKKEEKTPAPEEQPEHSH
jgi:hypothetical protein